LLAGIEPPKLENVMRKLESLVALGLIVVSTMPALADDTDKAGNSGASAAAGNGSDTGSTTAGAGKGHKRHGGGGGGGGGGGHHRGGAVPGMRQVNALPDLTDKQKSQLSTIYQANKPKFNDLRKQMEALKADEWQQVQGVLTPAQVQSLGGKSTAPASADDGGDAGGSASTKAPASTK
jgi:hypothetical protein